MTQKFIDRIFTEIDNNSTRLEKLAALVYGNSANIGFLKKLIMIIISFIIISSLGILYKTIRTEKQVKNEKSETSIILKDLKSGKKYILKNPKNLKTYGIYGERGK